MNTLPNDLEERELESVENAKWVNRYMALERLEKNPDFKVLILDGYFTDVALDAVSMLAHGHTVQTGKRPEVMEMLVAVSRLQDFFRVVKNVGAPVQDDAESELDASTQDVL